MRIVWEDERLEEVLADAKYPTEHAEPDVPVDPLVVDEDWRAVVSADRVITNMVQRRADAEYHRFEILGPVERPVEDADEYDLVEVDADPDKDRQPEFPTFECGTIRNVPRADRDRAGNETRRTPTGYAERTVRAAGSPSLYGRHP